MSTPFYKKFHSIFPGGRRGLLLLQKPLFLVGAEAENTGHRRQPKGEGPKPEGQLGADGVDQPRKEGAADHPHRLDGVEDTRELAAGLAGGGVAGDQGLLHGDVHHVKEVEDDVGGDEGGGPRHQADGHQGRRAEAKDRDDAAAHVGLSRQPDVDRQVDEQADDADGRLDDAVVGGGEAQLRLNVVVEGVVVVDGGKVGEEDRRQKEAQRGGHPLPHGDECLQGVEALLGGVRRYLGQLLGHQQGHQNGDQGDAAHLQGKVPKDRALADHPAQQVADGSSDTLICKDFKQQAVWNPSIQNMNSGNAVFNGVNAVLKLWKHTASQASAVY